MTKNFTNLNKNLSLLSSRPPESTFSYRYSKHGKNFFLFSCGDQFLDPDQPHGSGSTPWDPDQTPPSYVRYPDIYCRLPGGMSGREGRPREGGAALDGCGLHSAG
jgi:hypothetical protein